MYRNMRKYRSLYSILFQFFNNFEENVENYVDNRAFNVLQANLEVYQLWKSH